METEKLCIGRKCVTEKELEMLLEKAGIQVIEPIPSLPLTPESKSQGDALTRPDLTRPEPILSPTPTPTPEATPEPSPTPSSEPTPSPIPETTPEELTTPNQSSDEDATGQASDVGATTL